MLGFIEVLFWVLLSIILIEISIALIFLLIALCMFIYGRLTGKGNVVTKWFDENY